MNRNIVRKDVVIDDPDRQECLEALYDIKQRSIALGQSRLLCSVPNYGKLFFGSVDSSELTELGVELDKLIMEMGNSRDRVELDLLNGFPILQSHGVQPPFARKWANMAVGIVFPLGLLFELRAWLFSRKLKRQMVKTTQAAENLIEYMTNNK